MFATRCGAVVCCLVVAGSCHNGADPESMRADARGTMFELCEGIRSWHDATQRWPTTVAELFPPICKPPMCMHGFAPSDPWGHAYRIVDSGRYPALVTSGPDERLGTSDDMERTCDGRTSSEDRAMFAR